MPMSFGPGTVFVTYAEQQPFTVLHVHPYDNGVSELPMAVLTAMGTPLNLPTALNTFHWDYQSTKTSDLKSSEMIEAVYFNEFFVGGLGSVSFLGDDTDDIATVAFRTALASTPSVRALVLDMEALTHKIVDANPKDLEGQVWFTLVAAPMTSYVVRDNVWIPVVENLMFLVTQAKFTTIAKTLAKQTFMASMFNSIQNNPMIFFPDPEYRKLLIERAGRLCTYWGGLAEILDFQDIKPEDIPDLDFISAARASPTRLTDNHLALLSVESSAYDTREGKVLHRIKTTHADAVTRVAELEVAAAPAIRKLAATTRRTAALAESMRRIAEVHRISAEASEAMTRKFEQDNHELEKNRRVKESLDDRLITAQEEYGNKLQSLREDIRSNTHDYEAKLESLGVVITDAVMRHKISKEEKPLVGNEDLLDNEDWYLGNLGFITTRPHQIFVDKLKLGADAPVIVGGPYEVNLTNFYSPEEKRFRKPQMFLRLASIDAVFGKTRKGHEWRAKIHPHTQPSKLRPDMDSLKRFVESAHNVCLGEAETVIAQGFQTKDLFVVMIAVLSWISSANTQDLANAAMEDEYGKAWTWFPNPSEVNIAGGWSAPEPEPEPVAPVNEEEERWLSICKKLENAGLPLPKRPQPIQQLNTAAAALYMREHDEDSDPPADFDSLQS